MATPRFDLGKTVMTRGVADLIATGRIQDLDAIRLIQRHHCGDWGELSEADMLLNELALNPVEPDRVLSKYTAGGVELYCVTEWDRSVTTLLRCDEY